MILLWLLSHGVKAPILSSQGHQFNPARQRLGSVGVTGPAMSVYIWILRYALVLLLLVSSLIITFIL
ncbi:unnamed protein product [Lepidochelys olivacea]